jgi:catechol 2,3-dioxygenase-like lactoylglutathione lyase family enzyme
VRPNILDHVAFWVAGRDAIAERCVRFFGMHVIDRQDAFTLVGPDARRGKLTLFDAEGPRERGLFVHVGLRVSDLAAARKLLPERESETLDIGEGIHIRLVERETATEYDIDHVALLSPDPERACSEYRTFGFEPGAGNRMEAGETYVQLTEGPDVDSRRPLLNHLGLLVDSIDEHQEEATARGLEIESVVEATNTRALFLTGPDRVRLEYVEHRPTFSLV